MSLNEDQEILEDFLTEAGEILESLSEELVDLENSPDDKELLLSIFRGFHTLKGGASFLGFDAMVELSHRTEDVIEAIREDKIQVSSEIMDIVLLALDTLQDMRDQVAAGQPMTKNDPRLLLQLRELTQGIIVKGANSGRPLTNPDLVATLNRLNEFQASITTTGAETKHDSGSDDFDDTDFEALLDEIHGEGAIPGTDKKISDSKNISETTAEAIDFDDLLDEYYGIGRVPGQDLVNATEPEPVVLTSAQAQPDCMEDQDFDELIANITGEQLQIKQRHAAAEAGFTRQAADKTETKVTQASLAGPDQSIRVEVKRLDDIIDMVGELVLVRNRLATVSEQSRDEDLHTTSDNLDSVTRNLQHATMKTRLQPIRRVFSRFPRFIRDLGRSLNKNISLTLNGEDTELDKNVVDALAEPLIHLVRNAVDHGIETPVIRTEMGKPERGEITLSAHQEGEFFYLTVADDGAGINIRKLKSHALENELITETESETMSRSDALQLIFAPGTSTSSEVSEISGRGVGMDIVRNTVQQMNGSVVVESTQHVGTTITIKLPVTLAIFPALMVKVARQIYAIPVAHIREAVKVTTNMITTGADKKLLFEYQQTRMPLISLLEWQEETRSDTATVKEPYVVIYELDNKPIALLVDRVLTNEDVVIKSLGRTVVQTPGITGATITAEGNIALVLDVPELIRHYSGLG